jgi:hypothetical protein
VPRRAGARHGYGAADPPTAGAGVPIVPSPEMQARYRSAMLGDIHIVLALLAVALFALVGVAAVVSIVRKAPDPAAAPLDALVLVVIAMNAVVGVGFVIGGRGPRELLHYLYAFVAFAALPVADFVALRWDDRSRAYARIAGAAVGIVVVIRSFATG